MCVYHILPLTARLTQQGISAGTTKTAVKPTPVTQTTLPSSFGIKNQELNRTVTLESKI